MLKQSLAAALLLLSTQAQSAEVPLYSQALGQCLDKAAGVTSAMIECLATETKIQDKYLNEAYKRLMGQLSKERKTELRNAQRLWNKYRDANCKFYYDPDGGTLARVDASDCILRETAERARELDSLTQE